MKTRVFSAVVLLPLVILVMVLGGAALYLTLCVATLIGMHEFFKATNMKIQFYSFLTGLYSVMTYALYWNGDMQYLYMLNISLVILVLAYYALRFPDIVITDMAYVFYSVFYILFLMLAIAYVRDSAFYGEWMIWLIFAIAFGSDSSAYFVGVNFGKHKLVPKLSPNKTIEGAFGGLVGSGLIGGGFGLFMLIYGPFSSWSQVLILCVVGVFGSLVSQVGDLVGSAMKRQTGIKDFGKIIPGHGGILDRLDSILVTAAYIYLIQSIWSSIGTGI